ncbi:hypothetical protein FB567DRAFT_340263 [Paraphoma chrysanthemicola]|uniref:Uncharacterized protein n=1 Tax=Paraphoma chrysanthemicola TaxID=798071 RepID=A0A8K0R644_9PLEO|nr:hypothetical protein FB567DRAFT_340263 [Paraphoma chrysanthemicola]
MAQLRQPAVSCSCLSASASYARLPLIHWRSRFGRMRGWSNCYPCVISWERPSAKGVLSTPATRRLPFRARVGGKPERKSGRDTNWEDAARARGHHVAQRCFSGTIELDLGYRVTFGGKLIHMPGTRAVPRPQIKKLGHPREPQSAVLFATLAQTRPLTPRSTDTSGQDAHLAFTIDTQIFSHHHSWALLPPPRPLLFSPPPSLLWLDPRSHIAHRPQD